MTRFYFLFLELFFKKVLIRNGLHTLVISYFILSTRNGIYEKIYLGLCLYMFKWDLTSFSINKLGDSVNCNLQITLALLLGGDYSQGVYGLGPVSSKLVPSLW